jgi:molecular chaperone GrpE (heat shock protein)
MVDTDDRDADGTVASVRRSGWRLGSHLLRPMLVTVYRLPESGGGS